MSELRQAGRETFELVVACARGLLWALLFWALVTSMGMVNKREVVMSTPFANQRCTEDMPSCWKCRQMGNHQCTEGELVP